MGSLFLLGEAAALSREPASTAQMFSRAAQGAPCRLLPHHPNESAPWSWDPPLGETEPKDRPGLLVRPQPLCRCVLREKTDMSTGAHLSRVSVSRCPVSAAGAHADGLPRAWAPSMFQSCHPAVTVPCPVASPGARALLALPQTHNHRGQRVRTQRSFRAQGRELGDTFCSRPVISGDGVRSSRLQ